MDVEPLAPLQKKTAMIKRAQNRIAQSRWSLSVTAIYCILMFIMLQVATQVSWIQLPMLCAATVLMVLLNNTNSLIRIYSRMVSCSFGVMMIMSPFLFKSLNVSVAQLSFIIFLYFIFHAYQDKRAVGWVFYAYVALGIASIVYVQSLYLLPILWVLQATNVLAASLRTYCASLLGIAMPYWFMGAYCLYTGDPQAFADHFAALANWHTPFDFTSIDGNRLLTLAVVTLFGIIGTTHFLAYSYQDKIRTRMLFEMFIALEVCFMVLLLLQPQHFDMMLSLLILVVSPLIGHFMSLTHSRLSNITFFALIIIALLITVSNIWMS